MSVAPPLSHRRRGRVDPIMHALPQISLLEGCSGRCGPCGCRRASRSALTGIGPLEASFRVGVPACPERPQRAGHRLAELHLTWLVAVAIEALAPAGLHRTDPGVAGLPGDGCTGRPDGGEGGAAHHAGSASSRSAAIASKARPSPSRTGLSPAKASQRSPDQWPFDPLRTQYHARSYVARLLQLTNLAPDIVEAILDGKHAGSLSVARIQTAVPNKRAKQRFSLDAFS